MIDLYYSAIDIIALMILLIINHRVLSWKETDDRKGMKAYKRFIASIILFLVVDAAWGLCDYYGNADLLFYDAMACNITMSLTVTMCCLYVDSFLQLANFAGKVLKVFGIGFFIIDFIFLIINCFTPVLFRIDANGIYQTGTGRNIGMCTLMLLFVMISLLSSFAIPGAKGELQDKIKTISIFSLFLTVVLIFQGLFPLFPCYSAGLVTGIIILFSFLHMAEHNSHYDRIAMLNKALREKNSELMKTRAMLQASGIGTWILTTKEDSRNRLHMDPKMKQIMGLSKNSSINDADADIMLRAGINREDMPAFREYSKELHEGKRSECTYRWKHPTLGERFFRCGGIKVSESDGETVISGYHYDVTDLINKWGKGN